MICPGCLRDMPHGNALCRECFTFGEWCGWDAEKLTQRYLAKQAEVMGERPVEPEECDVPTPEELARNQAEAARSRREYDAECRRAWLKAQNRVDL